MKYAFVTVRVLKKKRAQFALRRATVAMAHVIMQEYELAGFVIRRRGLLEVKGKGPLALYQVQQQQGQAPSATSNYPTLACGRCWTPHCPSPRPFDLISRRL